MPELAGPLQPPGLVMWPVDMGKHNRMCVLISDVHCTDCTVGNQTASDTDWQLFFEQMEFAAGIPGDRTACSLQVLPEQGIDELVLILNGDIVDLIRSGKWAEAAVYPWHRDNPRFEQIVLAIMRDIVAIHARQRGEDTTRPYSGFFYWMRQSVARLRARGVTVNIVPIVGNHDKELQVVPAARQMFYEECLGLSKFDIPDSYRSWVAEQLGTSPHDPYPCLPFYFADAGLRLLATHGQWRDADNSRVTRNWKPAQGWQPDQWRSEQYRAFTEPCFGDTVAAGMLSRFIWSMSRTIDKSIPGASRICNILDEMDLYRPSVKAVVRLLSESRRLAHLDPRAKGLHDQVLRSFRSSLVAWMAHEETWRSAHRSTKLGLIVLSVLSRFHWYWLDISLMRLMAKVQEPEADIKDGKLLALPAFQAAYRRLGLRLHVEGHTHVALQADLQFDRPRLGRNNYTYINLGAWRDAILPKRNRGYRRRGVGRALFIFDFARAVGTEDSDCFRFYARDMISWGDRLDRW